jgi:hypothetical protein
LGRIIGKILDDKVWLISYSVGLAIHLIELQRSLMTSFSNRITPSAALLIFERHNKEL